ncbi:MAG: phosphoheptose isomerase [uncultured bacterium]|nr:MAG: phosphoheptose isomerase [uncultured bacterium]KKT02111.1 MAG: phosphoheptose isomerase, D-sedoheptulose 7-phosphate isomerase [Candidatus Peregrinibacteria bacterium GW2011_GWF2_43_17]KKT19021.1 MAG: Phosphoheptose isomerase [Candidatus Peregrinibacteria bacterium GW2011_GWA2_43_8]HAU40087.1 phosphoheptose isomerase [Candidatus Peregrinibacteria bacterium]
MQKIKSHLEDSSALQKQLSVDDSFLLKVKNSADAISFALKSGGKVLVAGNGGSASQSQHFVAELVGKYLKERVPQKAISLVSDVATMTSLANDFGYEYVFSKQVEALGEKGDVFVALSTSGNSENILEALEQAKKAGLTCIGLAGKDGGKMKDFCDHLLIIPSSSTPLIQESHLSILHILADLVEESL